MFHFGTTMNQRQVNDNDGSIRASTESGIGDTGNSLLPTVIVDIGKAFAVCRSRLGNDYHGTSRSDTVTLDSVVCVRTPGRL